MTAHEIIGTIFAILSAFGVALANVMQRKASLQQPANMPFGTALLGNLLRDGTWWLGMLGMVGGFVLQAVALGFGQLSTTETILTLEVPLTLLVASVVLHGRLGWQEWLGILLMTGGISVLVLALNPQPGNGFAASNLEYLGLGGLTLAAIVVMAVVSARGNVIWKTAWRGAMAGTCFGLTATLVKRTIDVGEKHGLVGVVTTWQTYCAIVLGISGIIVVQWALHTGPLVAAQPGFTMMDPVVSILWGVLVFQETTNTGWYLVLATVGAVILGIGVWVLARGPVFTALHESGGTSDGAPDPRRAAPVLG